MREAGPAESFTTAEIGDRDYWICGADRANRWNTIRRKLLGE
jgi:hypothetical protein